MLVEGHDVVVIGAGHNGLVAACYLARAGLDVVVAEAAPDVGGMTATRNVVEAAPRHRFNLCAIDILFLRTTGIVAELELDRHGYRELDADPAWVFLHPEGESLAFWRDPRRTAEEFGRFSASDGAAFLELSRTVDALVALGLPFTLANGHHPGMGTWTTAVGQALRHRRQLRSVGSLLVTAADQAIAERFRHPVVRDALAALTSVAIGPITAEGSALMLQLLGLFHRFGCGRAAGGTQSLPDALASALRASGGSIRTGAEVAEIVLAGGRAAGVSLVSGEVIGARLGVVATCDPRLALARLVPDGTLDLVTQARVDHIPAASFGATMMKVDVALDGRLSLGRHARRRGDGLDLRLPALLVGGLDTIHRAFRQAAGGRIPDDLPMWTCIPTGLDPSQAPDGQDTLYLVSGALPREPEKPWPLLAEAAGQAMVGTAADYFDGLPDLEIGRFVETPDLMAGRLFSPVGSPPFQGDVSLLRLGPLRPALGLGGSATPVAGLYIGGAGCHPGPAVSGSPGRLAARALLGARVTR